MLEVELLGTPPVDSVVLEDVLVAVVTARLPPLDVVPLVVTPGVWVATSSGEILIAAT